MIQRNKILFSGHLAAIEYKLTPLDPYTAVYFAVWPHVGDRMCCCVNFEANYVNLELKLLLAGRLADQVTMGVYGYASSCTPRCACLLPLSAQTPLHSALCFRDYCQHFVQMALTKCFFLGWMKDREDPGEHANFWSISHRLFSPSSSGTSCHVMSSRRGAGFQFLMDFIITEVHTKRYRAENDSCLTVSL